MSAADYAADAPPAGSPWWLYVATILGTVLVAYVAARGPVWVERAKARLTKQPDPPPAAVAVTASGETVLREWLAAERRENERLEKRIKRVEAELHRRGWDGKLP